LRDGGADASALPVFELAKQSYRAALLQRHDLWDAKFNLELALRAAPDPDPDDTGAPQVLTGERAVTTMRAFTLGLP
jgi:mxaK protein